MEEVKLAYIAGLFDGEGHCRIVTYQPSRGKHRYFRAQASISNTDRRCLDYVKQCLEFGWVGLNDRANTHKTRKHKKDCFKWAVSNAKCLEFLSLIRPYVKVKAEQIDAVLASPNHGRV